jgi:hypothetical protein
MSGKDRLSDAGALAFTIAEPDSGDQSHALGGGLALQIQQVGTGTQPTRAISADLGEVPLICLAWDVTRHAQDTATPPRLPQELEPLSGLIDGLEPIRRRFLTATSQASEHVGARSGIRIAGVNCL